MKKLIIIFALIAVMIALYLYFIAPKDTWENSTAQAIQKDFAQKYNRPVSSFMITVMTDTGKFAKGSVQFADQLGGGLWFAANTTSGWELAFDGNGIIPCDAANRYDFPADMVPQCTDTLHDNDLIQRLPPSPDNFIHDGVVIKDNPGFKPGVWFLSYEEPGSPALSVELDLNSVAMPYLSLDQGERVHVSGALQGSLVIVHSITPVQEETSTLISLYFYNPLLDQGPGGTQCSKKGLAAVQRTIPKTMTPLKDSIELLLRGGLSDEERARGIITEFPLPGVSLTQATIDRGVATLTFDDPQNKTSGGSCRVAILWAQIEATAKQFPAVTSVRFLPEELFQP